MPNFEKYQTLASNTFINQKEVKEKSTSEVLGVQRKPSPPRISFQLMLNKSFEGQITHKKNSLKEIEMLFSKQDKTISNQKLKKIKIIKMQEKYSLVKNK